MESEVHLQDGALQILDAVRCSASGRASVRIAVALAEDGVIPREEAVMRVEPAALSELLHRQIDPNAVRDVIVQGIAASPGAATGRIVLTAHEAQASAAEAKPAFWCAAKPPPRIFAACTPPKRC